MSKTSPLVLSVIAALAISTAGAPLPQDVPDPSSVTLPIEVRFDLSQGTLADIDRARAQRFIQQWKDTANVPIDGLHSKRSSSFAVSNDGVSYVTDVKIGSPPTTYSLLIDTGSSNTWVGSRKQYAQTSSSSNTGHRVNVNYGFGSFSGVEYTDDVSLSPDLSISQQSIGVASQSYGFNGIDGILGVGPTDLTRGTIEGVDTVPTVSDNLFSQHKISSEVLSVSFAPASARPSRNGQLTFGGVDSSKYTGDIVYTPITTTQPSTQYWGIDAQASYGSSTVLQPTAGIVDTGSTLVLIASDAFALYKQQTGAEHDSDTGLLKITPDQYKNLQSLYFMVGGAKFELTPNAQIWPRTLNRFIGGKPHEIYLVVADIGTQSGMGMDFILGYTFLEHFYSVFDTTNRRVGLATTILQAGDLHSN